MNRRVAEQQWKKVKESNTVRIAVGHCRRIWKSRRPLRTRFQVDRLTPSSPIR